MVSVNGKNKLERNINKLKKYFGLELIINGKNGVLQGNMEGIVGVPRYSVKVVKNGDLLVINLANDDEPFFVKPFFAFTDKKNKWVYFKPYGQKIIDRINHLIKGADEVFKLSEIMKNNLYKNFDPKNVFVSTKISNGKFFK